MDWIETNKSLEEEGRPLRLIKLGDVYFVKDITSEKIPSDGVFGTGILGLFYGAGAFQEALRFLDQRDDAKGAPTEADDGRRLDCVTEASAPQGMKWGVTIARLYDTNATCFEIGGTGADGAYNLVRRCVTAQEFCAELLKTLQADWGICPAGSDRPVPCRLTIHIGPAGTGDQLPL